MLLAETTRPLSGSEINEMVHRNYPFSLNPCSLQTTNEDLKTLQKCGFPVCRVDQDDKEIPVNGGTAIQGKYKNTKWRLREPSHLGEFTSPYLRQPTASDIISLSLCRALLQDEVPSQYPMRQSVSRILEELQIRLYRKLRHGDSVDVELHERVRRLGRQYIGKVVSNETWKKIIRAIAQHQVVNAEYTNREELIHKVNIAPLSVWFTEGRAYLLAAGAKDGELRVWRLDRFSKLYTDIQHSTPEVNEADIEDAIRQSFKGYVSEPLKIKIKVKSTAAYLFREFQYHDSQQFLEKEDGSLIVTMECATGWGFEEWLLGFGEFVTVVEPQELRLRLRERIRAMADEYLSD